MTGNNVREAGNGGLALVRKPVQRVAAEGTCVREGSTGRVVTMLPRVWAVAEGLASASPSDASAAPAASPAAPGSRPQVEVAFYRKYTQAMLRRYMRLSMETGRVPSLLGKEMFRGHVTHYRVGSFEDAVLFCLDVERCLEGLDPMEKELIRRVALQEYSQGEAAASMGLSLRSVVRSYGEALDRLTRRMLARRMLVPLKSCQ